VLAQRGGVAVQKARMELQAESTTAPRVARRGLCFQSTVRW
jgi:hypothetical protein